ncbi:MAG: cupin-like domain-containing protein [Proteobacteria bacterium]|nr:cupin-like domain-containing protein [Pseudomonadota bacterium]
MPDTRILPIDDRACALPAPQVSALSRLYPNSSGKLRHLLCGHPLLSLEALADAAPRMRPDYVEVRNAANRNGEPFAFAEQGDSDPATTIRTIATANRWVMLRFAEQLPEYDALMRGVIEEIAPTVRAVSGDPLRLQTFIFVSSPRTLTPFHFDPEYNILFQLAGRKHFAVYDPRDPWLPPLRSESVHRDGDNLLPWSDDFQHQGTVNTLDPGEAIYVPYKSPHWVEVDDQPSISLSITWCSRASFEQADTCRLNDWLRRHGMNPPPPPGLPAGAPLRSGAWRVLRRLGAE